MAQQPTMVNESNRHAFLGMDFLLICHRTAARSRRFPVSNPETLTFFCAGDISRLEEHPSEIAARSGIALSS